MQAAPDTDREATVALVRDLTTTDEEKQEFLDLYNNGYASETQYGIRIQKRGTGANYQDFVFDQYDGTTKTPLMILKADTKVGIGTNSPTEKLEVAGNVKVTGNLTVTGTKSSLAELRDGRMVTLYAVESPENWFEDFGTRQLAEGVAWVALDSTFLEVVNTEINYHVFLSANGDCPGMYVARKTPAGFEVREVGGAKSNISFDYRIVVRRRGYEAARLAQAEFNITPERAGSLMFIPPTSIKVGGEAL